MFSDHFFEIVIIWALALVYSTWFVVTAYRLFRRLRLLKPLQAGETGVGFIRGTVSSEINGLVAAHLDFTHSQDSRRPAVLLSSVPVLVNVFGGTIEPDANSSHATIKISPTLQGSRQPLPTRKHLGELWKPTQVKSGMVVWLAGQFGLNEKNEMTVGPTPSGFYLFATVNPRRWCITRMLLCLVFVAPVMGWSFVWTASLGGVAQTWHGMHPAHIMITLATLAPTLVIIRTWQTFLRGTHPVRSSMGIDLLS